MADIHKLIAAIRPEIYCDPEKRDAVLDILKKGGGIAKASEKAKPIKAEDPFNYEEANNNPTSKWGLNAPVEQHTLDYDSAADGLEPLYFWVLDFFNGMFGKDNIEKLSDTFASSPGSGHFSELGQKQTKLQEEAMKTLGAANQVIKSIINIIYDLKEFEIRLDLYKRYNNKSNKLDSESALLSLKQIWMDTVDIKRNTTSLKGLVQQFDYVTIIDAFMKAESLTKVNDLDLNDRVKRILQQRYGEFTTWLEASEKELSKRFEIEKKYLRGQVNTVKLYSRWVKPYLKAARALEQRANDSNPALVTVFNTLLLELTIMATGKYDPGDEVKDGLLPKMFDGITKKSFKPIVIAEFSFRGIPQRVGQHYTFGGRTEMKFTSYALTQTEIEVLKKELENDDFHEMLKWIEGTTTESLDLLEEDIKHFLEGDDKKNKEEEENKRKAAEDTNPFSSLFAGWGDFFEDLFKSKTKEEKQTDFSHGVEKDNHYEEILRSRAIISAREKCFLVFDIYKRAHGMAAHLNPYDAF